MSINMANKREAIYLLNLHEGMIKSMPREKLSTLRGQFSDLHSAFSKQKDFKCELKSSRQLQGEDKIDRCPAQG
jgi:hypothetical protein